MLGTGINLALANNPIVVNIDPYDLTGIADRSRIRYELDVYVFNGVNYDKVAELKADEEPVIQSADFNIYKGAFFRIDAVLKSFFDEVSYTDSLLSLENNNIVEFPELVLKYYTVSRVFVDNAQVNTATQAVELAYNGGVSEIDYESYGKDYFTDYIAKNKRFLHCGNSTTPDGLQYAAWIYNYAENIAAIRLKVIGKYIGGAEVTVYPLADMVVRPMSVYVVPVGGAAVCRKTGTEENKLMADGLLSYKVQLVDSSNAVLTEVVNVKVVQKYIRQKKDVAFVNSLGLLEGVFCDGKSYEEMTFSRVEGEAFRGFGYEAALSQRRIDVVEGQRRYILRTAWQKTEEARKISAVGFAKDVFLKDTGKWLPLVVVNKNLILKNDETNWEGIELELELGYIERAFSDLPQKAAGTSRPTAWRPLVTACQLDSRGKYNGLLEVITLELFYVNDNTAVKPAQTTANRVGKANYVAPVASAACAAVNTPFVNTLQSKVGSFNRTGCPSGEVGGPATISVAAGVWGSKISVADANAKALAEIALLDTQAYANTNGTCNTVGVYDPGVIPANRWWVRAAGLAALSGLAANENAYRPGNMWFQTPDQQANQTDVNLFPRFNVSYPVLTSPRKYVFHAYDGAGKTIRFFRNGLLVGTQLLTGQNNFDFPANPANGDKWWIDVI